MKNFTRHLALIVFLSASIFVLISCQKQVEIKKTGLYYNVTYALSNPTGAVQLTVHVNDEIKTDNVNGVLVSGSNTVFVNNTDELRIEVIPNVQNPSKLVVIGYNATTGQPENLIDLTIPILGGTEVYLEASTAYSHYDIKWSN